MDWIKIKNKKPKLNKDVLFYNKNKGIVNGLINKNKKIKIYGIDNFYKIEEFEYWMPLPDLPCESKK